MKFFLLVSFVVFGSATSMIAAESFVVGKISWDADIFHKGSDFFAKKVQVIDSDMNQNQAKIEKIPVRIYSDSDPIGIIVNAHETGNNTGIFEILIYVSQKDSSSGQRIHSDVGDTVTAEYKDMTVPDIEYLRIHDVIEIDKFSQNDESITDSLFFRQGLQTGQTIPNIFVIQIVEGLGPGLIILFIVIYAIKNRREK